MLLHSTGGDWWSGHLRRDPAATTGWFPGSFVQVIAEPPQGIEQQQQQHHQHHHQQHQQHQRRQHQRRQRQQSPPPPPPSSPQRLKAAAAAAAADAGTADESCAAANLQGLAAVEAELHDLDRQLEHSRRAQPQSATARSSTIPGHNLDRQLGAAHRRIGKGLSKQAEGEAAAAPTAALAASGKKRIIVKF